MITVISPEPAGKNTPEKNISFRWSYIVLPAAVLLLSVVLAASFYTSLPGQIAYHFEDGAPDRWLSRGAVIAWMIVPQFVFVLFALVIISVAIILSTRLRLAASAPIRKLLSIMGNMVGLPQLILTFAMLDIFLYNAYQIHLMPLWAFALVVMVLGGIILVIFFIQALGQLRGLPDKSL